jgi:hypothetical protein
VARAVFNAAAPIFVKADAGECKKARTRGCNVARINYAGAPMKGIVWAALVAAAWANAQPPSAGGLNIDANSFRCITSMTHMRHFYVDNLEGDLQGTIAAANAKNGAVYPPGSVVQLVPGEAMVKLDKGASPATHDWEYFELDVSKDGTRIRRHGFADVVNRFGGNCFGCHVAARPEWDSICETDHGCAPIPVTRAMSAALQRTDPRCGNTSVSPEDAEALRQLDELTKTLARPAK